MKNKKLIIIIATVLVAIAGVGAIAYVISNDKKSESNPGAYYGSSADGFTTSVDRNEHLGTVEVVSKDAVAAAFGQNAEVGSPEESGTVKLGATKSETATFAVKTPKGKVSFEVDVRTYSSRVDLDKAGVFVGTQEPKVEGVGEEAHFLVPAQQDLFKEQQVALIATKGKTSYKFALVQQSDNLVFTTDEAKAIVLEIAKQSNLGAVK